MSKNHVKIILDGIGHDTLVNLGMPDRTIRHAREVGHFSGLWYDLLARECENRGIVCPRAAFSWKVPPKKLGSGKAAVQAQPAEKINAGGSA